MVLLDEAISVTRDIEITRVEGWVVFYYGMENVRRIPIHANVFNHWVCRYEDGVHFPGTKYSNRKKQFWDLRLP